MRLISNISAFASIIAFIFPFLNQEETKISNFQYITLFIFIIATLITFFLEYKNRPKTYKNETEIGDYMKNWISKTGRTVIFTRDMSWANTKNIKDELIKKSTANELIMCMPKKTGLANELENLGAEIIEYSNLNYTPTSRFTIVHYGRSDAKLAIGRTDSAGKHIITEFENGLHTQFHLAEDLVNILKEISK